MSLRIGLLTCVMGLGTALLPGCTSSAGAGLDARDQMPSLPNFQTRPLQSPYHPQGEAAALPAEQVRLANHEKPAPDAPPPPKKEETPARLNALPPLASAGDPVAVKPVVIVQPGRPQDSKKNAPADEPLVLALRAYLQKRPPDALEALSHYSRTNQDMLLVALPFIARLTEGDLDRVSPREAAELADLIRGIEERLRQRAALRIEKMFFCRKIDAFGEYVVRETVNGMPTFEGGAGDRPGEPVLVYVELRNVSCKQHGDSYETRLAGSVELLDFEGRSAYRQDFKPDPTLSQSARHDFFASCSFSVPRKVPPGRYTLRVEVRDISSLGADPSALKQAPPPQRVARQSIDLQVIEPRPERATADSR